MSQFLMTSSINGVEMTRTTVPTIDVARRLVAERIDGMISILEPTAPGRRKLLVARDSAKTLAPGDTLQAIAGWEFFVGYARGADRC